MKSLLDYVQLDHSSFVGTNIGSVTILKEIGRGNKGVVFIGFQHSLKRKVAVKILPKITAGDVHEEELFKTEAEIVAGLNHPNIIPIYEMGETDEFFFHVMQLVEGFDLNTIINRRLRHPIAEKQKLSYSEIFNISQQVLDALYWAHQDSIIHRDIKPSNILIDSRSGRPFIADFGIAFSDSLATDAHPGLIMGSPVYLAPEQARGESVDQHTDIYAMGMTLIKMLGGIVPRRKESPEMIVRRKAENPESFLARPLSELRAGMPVELEKIIAVAIAPRPENRFESCAQFRNVLLRFQQKHLELFNI